MNNEAGNRDASLPYSVDMETYADNWEKTFGKKAGKTCMYSGLPHVENYMDDDNGGRTEDTRAV